MAGNNNPPTQLHPDLSYRDLVAFINDNFRKLNDSLNTRLQELENPIYYAGDIQNEVTGTTYKVLGPTRESYSGITKTNSSTLTVKTKGLYYIHIQQLISTVNAGYFVIRINNNDLVYGYYTANSMNDVPAHVITELSVGDTIRVYQSAAITTSWAGAHSDISVYCIKRT